MADNVSMVFSLLVSEALPFYNEFPCLTVGLSVCCGIRRFAVYVIIVITVY